MKGVLLALVLAAARARAELPADAPRAVAVQKGDVVAADGVCMPTDAATTLFQTCQAAELENKEYVKALEAPGWTPGAAVLIGGGVAAVVVGFVVGFLVFHG